MKNEIQKLNSEKLKKSKKKKSKKNYEYRKLRKDVFQKQSVRIEMKYEFKCLRALSFDLKNQKKTSTINVYIWRTADPSLKSEGQ